MVRIKHRYLLVHILNPEPVYPKTKTISGQADTTLPDLVQFHSPSPDGLTPQLLVRAIKDQVQLLYGDYGLGLVSSSLNIKYLSPATSTAIVRCSRAHYRLVWAALSFLTQLPKMPKQTRSRACVMQVVRVSGTIKKVEEEAITRARAAISRAKRESEGGVADGLMGLLGDDGHEAAKKAKGRMAAVSDVSDEDDEVPIDSDEDG